MDRRERALMLTVPSLAPAVKQQNVMLKHAMEHRYDVTSVTSMPEAARALAEAHLIEVIMVVTHTAATFEMRGHAILAGVRVEELREGAYQRRLAMEQQREREFEERLAEREEEILARLLRDELRSSPATRMILDATRRGIPPEQIAAVFDLPESTVYEAIGKHMPEPDRTPGGNVQPIERARRARELTRPGGRR